jgi:glycosyltransferase involved in cell wall biosynthesis
VAEPRLSAVVIARDEEAHLPDCLAALAFADEVIVVVDEASRDATEAIARASADRVVVRPFDSFAAQRNAGRAAASGRWILAIDADERVTAELAAEIRATVEGPAPHSGYRVPIRSVIFGRPFVGSGTQLDRPVRLFLRERGRWSGEVHETVALDGPIGDLRSLLLHRTHETLSVYLGKLDRYTTLEARALAARGRRPRLFDLTLRPLAAFLKLYFGRGGVWDGVEGFLFCALSGVSVLVRNAKLRELTRRAVVPAIPASPAEVVA